MALFQNIHRIFMKYRDTFKTMSNIYDETFCQNSQRFNPNLGGQDLVKYPMNKNFRNSRTSNDIHIKLGTLSKLEKKSTIKSKELDDDVILTNYDPIITFLIY